MNNLKKVALTALGASLAATSANAVDVSVSGGSEIGWATGTSNNAGSKASSFGVGTGVSFSASGELDNGWTVSTTHATSGAFALTSSKSGIVNLNEFDTSLKFSEIIINENNIKPK